MSISALFDMIQNNISLIIILIFAGVPLLIGSTAANRSVSTISDFFLCNRSLGTALSFCTIYATWWSSFAFLGSTSSFYTQGPLYWIALGWNVLFGILFCVFGKPLWQQSRLRNYRTPVDFFHDKYHSRPLDIAAILLMVGLSIPYISVQFLGGGIIIEMATNGLIPWRISALLFFMIMILYIWSGGLRAIAWTDTLYSIMIFSGMLLIGILFIHMTGGVGETFSELAKTHPENLHLPAVVDGTLGAGFWFSLLVIMPLGELMMPQIWIRTYAVKKSRTFDAMPFLLSIATLAYLGTMLAGNAAAVLEPDYPGASDYILPAMLIKYLPPVLMAFIICCTAAACLSTANSQLHSISEILTLDIYKTYFYRKAPEKHLILAAKGFILLIAMLAYLLLLFGNLSTIFQTAFLAFSGIIQLAVPAVGGLFWKKRDARSALSGSSFRSGSDLSFLFMAAFRTSGQSRSHRAYMQCMPVLRDEYVSQSRNKGEYSRRENAGTESGDKTVETEKPENPLDRHYRKLRSDGRSADHPSGSQSPEHRPHPDPLPVRLRIVDRPVCPDLYRMENAMGREE